MLENIRTMFAPGPKERTTAAYLAIGLGWTGMHKFYLGYRNAGPIHAALTGLGVMVLIAQSAAPTGSIIPVFILAWLVIPLGYFYVRRFQLGHSLEEILSPGRLLLLPWRLLRYTFRVVRQGSDIMEEEKEERRLRRRGWGRGRQRGRRRDRRYDDDDDDGCSAGIWVIVLGIILSLAVAAAIIFLYFIILSLVGVIAIVGSIAIGVVEGLGYLKKTDAEFQQAYVANRRLWF